MPTYGFDELPEVGTVVSRPEKIAWLDPRPSPEPLEAVLEAAKRVRDECLMDLSDTALERLVEASVTAYREALDKSA